MNSSLCLFASLAMFSAGSISLSQEGRRLPPPSYDIPAHYKKIQYMVPMRDGVKLFTNVYVPIGVPGKHPCILERTCYGAGPFEPDAYPRGFRGSPKLKEAGYIFAFQDVRGKGYSEGEYVNIRPQLKPGQKGVDESTDTYDTIDYLVKNVPDNNKHFGLWGISYPGFYAGVGSINTHPALAAVSPQAPVSDWFLGDDVHHNGAFFVQDNFSFSAGFDVPRPGPGKRGVAPTIDRETDAYDFYLNTGALPNFDKLWYKGLIPYWNELMDHGTYDQYWKDRSLTRHLKNIKCAVLVVGGWFDAEDQWGALNDYQAIKKMNPGVNDFLVMGPWYHGMWASPQGTTFGDLDYGQNTSTYYQDNIEFPFFEKFLHNQPVNPPAAATVFETGRNKWHAVDVWPPTGLSDLRFFLNSDGRLSNAKPKTGGEAPYTYDPANPTPYLADYKNNRRRTREYMVDDQRFAEKRSDVVTFKTEPLKEDLTVAGKIDADVWIKTTGTDADLIVKVIDVWPDESTVTSPKLVPMAGYEQMLKGDIFRGKFRNSFEKPEPFKPGEPTRVHFKLNDTYHTFLKGHRVMVQIQSAWFPLVDRNSNMFEDLYHAKNEDFHPATISVLFDSRHSTSIGFGQMKGGS